MEHLWARWSAQKGRRFDDWYQEERNGLYPAWMQLYGRHLSLQERYFQGDALTPEGLEDIINPPMPVMVVFGLTHHFQEAGASFREAHGKVRQFFASETALAVPANEISSLLMAALARKAAAGQKKVPNRGTPNDINAISSYLPYCEALFVDDQFAGLLREKPLVDLIRPYRASVYSNRTRAAFLKYLVQVERDVASDHRERVIEVYGEEWLISFQSILEDQRKRRGTTDARET